MYLAGGDIMLPDTSVNPEIFSGFNMDIMPSQTWKIDFETGRVKEAIDEVEALKQSIYCILRTERYEYLIHSRNYGIELDKLYGKNKRFVIPELQRYICEALYQDERITNISGFEITNFGKSYAVSFKVDTVFNQPINITDEVMI